MRCGGLGAAGSVRPAMGSWFDKCDMFASSSLVARLGQCVYRLYALSCACVARSLASSASTALSRGSLAGWRPTPLSCTDLATLNEPSECWVLGPYHLHPPSATLSYGASAMLLYPLARPCPHWLVPPASSPLPSTGALLPRPASF